MPTLEQNKQYFVYFTCFSCYVELQQAHGYPCRILSSYDSVCKTIDIGTTKGHIELHLKAFQQCWLEDLKPGSWH